MDEGFTPRITIRYGANPHWRAYVPNWSVIRGRGFLVSPQYLGNMLGATQPQKLANAQLHSELCNVKGVTLFHVRPNEVTAECHEPFPGWEVVEAQIIDALKQTLPSGDKERLLIAHS